MSLDEIKAHLRVETADEDVYLGELAAAAVAHVEAASGKRLIDQTWRIYLDDWPQRPWIELPLSPVRSIVAINVFDEQGVATAIAPGQWQLDAVSDPPRLVVDDVAAPARAINGIEIEVAAGYGESGTDVPDGLKRAILVLAAHWYEARGSAIDAAALGREPAGFRKLLAPFRRPLL